MKYSLGSIEIDNLTPLVELRNVSFTYTGSRQPALTNVSLSIGPGEFVLLTGPSGCGKSSLCRCLNGLIPNFYHGKLEGEIFVKNLTTRGRSTAELSRVVGQVFQNPENQLFSLSVERDVAFGPENLGLPWAEVKARTEWAMDLVGVAHLKDKAPYELSSGQQQKAALASVLAMKPEMVVLDEPTSFLDPASARTIVQDIDRLRRELGMSILVVEHRLDLLAKFVDRTLLMEGGELLADGTPQSIFGEKARLIGVGLPKLAILWNLLKLDGYALGETPLTAEDASNRLRRFISDNRF